MTLSERTLEALQFAADGFSVDETARKMFLTEAGVKYHRWRAIQLLRARNMYEAIAIGFRKGLLQ